MNNSQIVAFSLLLLIPITWAYLAYTPPDTCKQRIDNIRAEIEKISRENKIKETTLKDNEKNNPAIKEYNDSIISSKFLKFRISGEDDSTVSSDSILISQGIVGLKIRIVIDREDRTWKPAFRLKNQDNEEVIKCEYSRWETRVVLTLFKLTKLEIFLYYMSYVDYIDVTVAWDTKQITCNTKLPPFNVEDGFAHHRDETKSALYPSNAQYSTPVIMEIYNENLKGELDIVTSISTDPIDAIIKTLKSSE